ncbi:MAG: LURP-one-related/scramblase family protein [Halobacteriota archaeon]
MGDLLKTRELVLSEKLISLRDRVNVMDVNGHLLGIFSSELLYIGGRTYRLYDAADEHTPLLTVKEKMLAVRSTYTFYKGEKRDENEIGKLKQELVALTPHFWFEDPSGNTLFTMEGDLFALDYRIVRGDTVIAEISRELFHITDTYGVRMDPYLDDDTAMIVLGAVIMLHHEKEERQENR